MEVAERIRKRRVRAREVGVKNKWSWGVFAIQRNLSPEDLEGCTVEMEGRKDAVGLRR